MNDADVLEGHVRSRCFESEVSRDSMSQSLHAHPDAAGRLIGIIEVVLDCRWLRSAAPRPNALHLGAIGAHRGTDDFRVQLSLLHPLMPQARSQFAVVKQDHTVSLQGSLANLSQARL